MPQTLFFISFVLAIFTMTGCGSGNQHSGLRDLAASRDAKNIAVLVGAPTNLPGIDLDLNMMNEVLSGPNGAFEVRRSWRQSASAVVETVRQAAVDVGDNGTLFFFFSGHGAQNGQLLAESGGMLDFDRITAAIKESRTRPLKRFMVFVDACFSGNLVNGTVAVGRDDRPDATVVALRSNDGEEASDSSVSLSDMSEMLTGKVTAAVTKNSTSYAATLTEQLLVLSAANRNTTSLAGGDGSTFTKGVWQAFRDMAKNRSTTIRSFLKQVHENTRRNSGGHHTPVYRVFPEKAVLDDLLSGTSEPDAGGGTVTNPPTSTESGDLAGIDADVAIALGTADANGRAQAFIAGKAGLKRLLVCRGTRAQCVASPVAALDFTLSQKQISGRTVYESAPALTLPENEVFTVIGYGADSKIVSAASFRLARR
jgi:hypothetical protein